MSQINLVKQRNGFAIESAYAQQRRFLNAAFVVMEFVTDAVGKRYSLVGIHHGRVKLKNEVLIVQIVVSRKQRFGLLAFVCHRLVEVDACLLLAVYLRYVVYNAVNTLYKLAVGVCH